MDFMQQLDHARKYAAAFWQHEMIDRPYVCVTAPKGPSDFVYSQALCWRHGVDEQFEKIVDPFIRHIDKVYYGGEALPSLMVTLGPDQYGAFFGGQIQGDLDNGTTWLLPFVEDWADFDPVMDLSEKGYFQILKRFYTYAGERTRGKCLVQMMDLHSNLDVLSAIRGAVNLCMDMLDCPEDVHRVLDKVNDTYPMVYDMVYDATNSREYGTIGWSPIYCEGKSAVLQCDFSCLLSPDMGREFMFPSIEREMSHLDRNIYHLDGKDALVHLDTILGMDKIDCIQWVPGAGQPRTLEWMDLLKKIQKAGKSLWIYDWTVEEIKRFHKELQPDKVAYDVCARSPQEADELLEFLTKNT